MKVQMKPTYVPSVFYNGSDQMAMINADGSWTVDWDVVAQVAGRQINLTDHAAAVMCVALANLLSAAKGNFQDMTKEHATKVGEEAYPLQMETANSVQTTINVEPTP